MERGVDQTNLEHEMAQLGKDRQRRRLNKALEQGIESTTPAGQALLGRSIGVLTESIERWLEEARHAGGKGHVAGPYLELLPADVAAAVACRSVVDAISQRRRFTSAALHIASAIEDEVRFRALKGSDPEVWASVRRKTAPYGYATRRKWAIRTMELIEHPFEGWPKRDKARLGALLLHLIDRDLGLVKLQTRKLGPMNTSVFVEPDDRVVEWLSRNHARAGILTPVYLPLVSEPKDWTSPVEGGYYSPALHRRALVKARSPEVLALATYDKCPEVYNAVNRLQRTPWTVNGQVLEVAEFFWERGIEIEGLSLRDDEPLPERPADIATNKEARLAWRRAAALVHDKNAATKAGRVGCGQLLHVARKFVARPFIYFCHQLDWRGRMYPLSYFLHPQGPDLARGLLKFGREDHLTTEGERWLAVHGANVFGEDKRTLDGRVQWVEDHRQEIIRVADDPYRNQWWRDADKPWQFLAFCFEWVHALSTGMTSLPCAQDATQSGIQIISMLTRDQRGARATNVIDTPKPADLYGMVAAAVSMILEGEDDELARAWLGVGVDRKTCKRAVMTRVYNATKWSAARYVEQWLDENGDTFPLERRGDRLRACTYLAGRIRDSMQLVVPGLTLFMEWCAKVANEIVRRQADIRWTSPLGFPVIQDYRKTRKNFVYTRFGEKVRKMTLRTERRQADRLKAVNGFAPNFVHSLDAAMLQRAITLSGIYQIGAVHDSVSTTAPKMGQMNEALRRSAFDLFRKDLLQKFRSEILESGNPCQAPPEYGTLKVQAVLDSTYFFS